MIVIAIISSFLIFLDDTEALKNQTSGSKLNMEILSFYPCKGDKGYINLDVHLRTIDESGSKAVDIAINLDNPLTTEYQTDIRIDLFRINDWQEIFSTKESFCEIMDTYAAKPWEKFRKAATPPIKEPCYIEKGSYTATKFQVNGSEYDVPPLMFGKFRITFKTFDPLGELATCYNIEIVVS